MPFRSVAQQRFMWATAPKMAAEWQSHTPSGKLPEKVEEKGESKQSTFKKQLDSLDRK